MTAAPVTNADVGVHPDRWEIHRPPVTTDLGDTEPDPTTADSAATTRTSASMTQVVAESASGCARSESIGTREPAVVHSTAEVLAWPEQARYGP